MAQIANITPKVIKAEKWALQRITHTGRPKQLGLPAAAFLVVQGPESTFLEKTAIVVNMVSCQAPAMPFLVFQGPAITILEDIEICCL